MKYQILDLFRVRSRISERIAGDPLEIRGPTIRAVVRASGWRGAGGGVSADGTGVWLRVEPQK